MGIGSCTGASGFPAPPVTSSSIIFGFGNGAFRSGRRVEHPQQQIRTSTQSVERMNFRLIDASLREALYAGSRQLVNLLAALAHTSRDQTG